jgi:hypothetical protein
MIFREKYPKDQVFGKILNIILAKQALQFSDMNNVRPIEKRALGWYAIRWVHVTDWYKAHLSRHRNTKNINYPTSVDLSSIPEVDKKDSEEEKLKSVVQESSNLLTKAKSMFPFTLFPNVITIDRHKLTIVYKTFFYIEQTVSVPIENIKNIQADIGPLFGSLTITSDHFINNTQQVNYLRRDDTKKIQKLIQGAMVAINENIDISKIDTKQLKNLLCELGEGHTSTLQT